MTIHREIRWRVITVLLVVAGAALMVYPPEKNIRLGLDLRGGTHLRFEVQTSDAVAVETDQAVTRLRETCREKGWAYSSLQRAEDQPDVFIVAGADEATRAAIAAEIKENYDNDWSAETMGTDITVRMRGAVRIATEDLAVRQALDTIRNRVDEYGVAEPTIQREGLGSNRIVVQLPGVDDPERAKELVKKTAFLEWKELAGNEAESRAAVVRQWPNNVVPEGVEILPGQERTPGRGKAYFPVRKTAILTGRDLSNSRPTTDELGLPAVAFMLNMDGAERVRAYSEKNIGQRLAIILDGQVLSAPVIREKLSANNIISGRFSSTEAQDLSIQLRAGALPAKLLDLEERSIGPSLGADAIRRGLFTGMVSLGIIFTALMIFYRLSGLNAMICLLMNLLIIFGALGLFQATLTLPGVAGLVLTIGMAVDANILIFERIKEEFRAGKTPRAAVGSGFDRAFTAILDSNLTTIIACVFLFQFGTGPIKGFAVTMIIGLLSNLFTAVFVSRTFFEMMLGPRTQRVEKLSI